MTFSVEFAAILLGRSNDVVSKLETKWFFFIQLAWQVDAQITYPFKPTSNGSDMPTLMSN